MSAGLQICSMPQTCNFALRTFLIKLPKDPGETGSCQEIHCRLGWDNTCQDEWDAESTEGPSRRCYEPKVTMMRHE